MEESVRLNSKLSDHMLIAGILLAIVYWVLDSIMSIFFAFETSLVEKAFGWNVDELSMRVIVLCLFAIFGSHAQHTINERKKAAVKIEEAKRTRERFQRLLSPDLAERVVSGELKVEKGGEDRIATVLFADIRGFTRLSSNTDASEVLKMLNEFYEMAVREVFQFEGTVDKFMGDGMMVIWGAPVEHSDDPIRAIRAAISIQLGLSRFNEDRIINNLPPIDIGIGINTGSLMAGYIGSSLTMSYSVVGDTVNMAARLCSAAKKGEIIISESTREHLSDHIEIKALEPVKIKGKDELINIYSVVGENRS